MAGSARNKCQPHVPYKRWAEEAGIPDGNKETQNWNYFEDFMDRYQRDCACGSGVGIAYEVSWVFGGVLVAAGIESPPFFIPEALTLDTVKVLVDTADTTGVQVRVHRNGSQVGSTLNTTTGTTATGSFSQAFTADSDKLQFRIHSIGDGVGIDLAVSARFITV